MQNTSIIAVCLYIILLLIIGIFASKKNTSSSNYILGNRSLGYWVTAISANASDMSVWLFMGLPMSIYRSDLLSIWMPVGLILFMFLNWQIIAKPLRVQSEALGALTLSSFIEKKIAPNKKTLRILLALSSVFFLTIYISAGIIGMGYLFEQLFSLNYYTGCIVSIFAILIYISIGGFSAICYTDFIQGLFLLFIIIIVPSIIIYDYFYLNTLTLASNNSINFQDFIPKNAPDAGKVLLLVFSWGLGYFGQPHILSKFMAIKDAQELNKAKWIGTIWQILALSASIATGLAAHLFFTEVPANPEMIFVIMAKAIFPSFLAAFALCAILAATLSTIDSQIIVAASVISQDFYCLLNKKASDKKILLVSRVSAIFICLIALSIALFKNNSIHDAVYYCWSGLGSSFGPLLIATLYGRKLNYNYCVAALIVCVSIGIFWNFFNTGIPTLIPGFLLGFLIIFIGSKVKSEN